MSSRRSSNNVPEDLRNEVLQIRADNFGEVQSRLEKEEKAKQELKNELEAQRELVKQLQNQKSDMEKLLTNIQQENQKHQLHVTAMHEQVHQLKHEVQHSKSIHSQCEEKIREKDVILKERAETIEVLQLQYTELAEQLRTQIEKRPIIEVQQPVTASRADLEQSLKEQIENFKNQLKKKDETLIEKTRECEQINELNYKLETQNKSLSDRIKVLEEKVTDRENGVSVFKAAKEYLGEQLTKAEKERDTLKSQIKEMEGQIKEKNNTTEYHPIKQNLKEKIQEIEKLQQERKEMQEATYKEKQEMQQRMQQLEQSLEKAIQTHNTCEENTLQTPRSGINDNNINEKILEEMVQIQNQIKQYNEDLSKQIQETGANVLVIKKDIETTMKGLNVEECNLNLKVAQLIQNDPIHRQMFEWIIGKFKMIFSDCRIILSQYVDTKPEFGNSVANGASQLVSVGAMLLNNVPTLGLILQLTEFVIGVCGDKRLGDLFDNVSKFENKIMPENTSTFAKIFALQLFDLEEFQMEKKEREEERKLKHEKEKNQDKWLQDLVENYCDRALVVLTTGVMGDLWENIIRRKSQKVSGTTNNNNNNTNTNNANNTNGHSNHNNNDSELNVICILEQLIERMLPVLSVGSTMREFKEQLKTKCEEMGLDPDWEPDAEPVPVTPSAVTTPGGAGNHSITNNNNNNSSSNSNSNSNSNGNGNGNSNGNSNNNNKSKILKQGVLEKEGAYFFSQPQKRNFLLYNNGILSYEKMNGKIPVRYRIDLLQAKAIKKLGHFGLIVETVNRNWSFTCATGVDRDDWFAVIGGINGVKCYECEGCSKKQEIKTTK